jgi:hypothetical protein
MAECSVLAASSKARMSSCSASLSRWDSPLTASPLAWFAGMIDQAAWMRKPHQGFRSEHLEHVTTKRSPWLPLSGLVCRLLTGHLERQVIGGPTRRSAGRRITVADGHQPQAGLTNQMVQEQGQRPTLQPPGTCASGLALMRHVLLAATPAAAVVLTAMRHAGPRRTPLPPRASVAVLDASGADGTRTWRSGASAAVPASLAW